jgi:hypothetical protein
LCKSKRGAGTNLRGRGETTNLLDGGEDQRSEWEVGGGAVKIYTQRMA